MYIRYNDNTVAKSYRLDLGYLKCYAERNLRHFFFVITENHRIMLICWSFHCSRELTFDELGLREKTVRR